MVRNAKPDETALDFAVVGAGIAGLYAAWRILGDAGTPRSSGEQVQAPPRVAVFEATEREGGRLLTVKMPGMPYRAELGGMRYTEGQILVSTLIEKLEIQTLPFDFPFRCARLRGSFCTDGSGPFEYRLTDRRGQREKGKAPGALMRVALRRALLDLSFSPKRSYDQDSQSILEKLSRLRDSPQRRLKLTTFTPREWEVIKRYGLVKGQPLFRIGLWNLLHYYLSREAFLLLHDGLGYESIVGNWNAAEAIPWFLADFGHPYRTPVAGMEYIANRLLFEIKSRDPDCMNWKHELVEVEFAQGTRSTLKLHFQGKDVPVEAKQVILALPQRVLRRIRFSGFDKAHAAKLTKLLETVTPHTLFKLFLGYERAWWYDERALRHQSGRAVTDLPIRQVYYWGPDKAFPPSRRGMLMASYSDSHYVDFWRPLHRLPIPGEAKLPFFYTGSDPLGAEDSEQLQAFGATEAMARKAHRQVLDLHPRLGEEDVPFPYVALEKEWQDGWHTWKPHVTPWLVRTTLAKPFEQRLGICGEAFSCEQGWVEGALRSAELVLSALGLTPPSWVSERDIGRVGYSTFEEYIGHLSEP